MPKSKDIKIAKNLELAQQLHQRGQIPQAMATYKKILRAAPAHPDALHYLGLAYYQTGNIELAINNIKRAIVLAPKYPDAMNNLANIYKENGRQQEASELYLQVLQIAPLHTNTLVNIAITLRDIKQPKKALSYLQQAVELEPSHAAAQHNLANIYVDLQQPELAMQAYTRALQLDPHNHETSKNLAHTLSNLGRINDAIAVLQELLSRRPDDAIAQHLLAAYGGSEIPERATDLYVRQTFDAFSANFDTTLASLQYIAPQLVSNKVIALLEQPTSRVNVLDIGCGTGLCGSLLKPMTQKLIGVDLSPKMLQKAEQLKLYDELHEAELCTYMQTCQQRFDYVVCVDTFVYFGALGDAFIAAYQVLSNGGRFIFTVEQHQQTSITAKDYVLQPHGRYSHSQTYLRKTLAMANFMVCSIEDVIPRMENGKAVNGALVVAQKT